MHINKTDGKKKTKKQAALSKYRTESESWAEKISRWGKNRKRAGTLEIAEKGRKNNDAKQEVVRWVW